MATTRKQPITVLGLGLGGVNLVKNALILDDNEVTLAQNAVPFSEDGGVSGIRKRDGLQRVVPTGSVTPGSDAGGAILGGFTIDDPVGYSSPDGATQFAPNSYKTASGTWTAYTPDQTTFPDPNVIYNYLSGFDGTKSTVYPPVAYPSTGAYYYGGHVSGQILEARLTTRAFDQTPPSSVVVREVGRVVGTGSNDDTYICSGMFQGNLVVALSDGGVWLFYPPTGATTKLPAVPNAAPVTGAAEAFGRLWVVAGLKLYNIGTGSDGNYETSWTTAATVSDAGIVQLLGLCRHTTSGKLFAGSYLSTGTLPAVLRVYAFTPLADGTATTLTFPTDGTTGPFNGPASVQVNASPAYLAVQGPMALGDDRLYAIYLGSAAAFVQLLGAVGEDMAGTSLRVLSYDGSHWHNGADTNTDDVRGDAMSSAAGSISALILTLDSKFQYASGLYSSSGNRLPGIIRNRFDGTPDDFSLAADTGTHANAFWGQPLLLF